MIHKTVTDYIPLVRSMTADAFVQRNPHPFLFGREVLEEEFRFSTVVTDERSILEASVGATTDVLRIRHWIIAVKKPPTAPAQDRIFLGRGESNDICLPHKTISKLHAYFQRDPANHDRWFVVDAGSANGTKHNGLATPPRAKVVINDNDSICFGRCLFQWMLPRSLYDRVSKMAG